DSIANSILAPPCPELPFERGAEWRAYSLRVLAQWPEDELNTSGSNGFREWRHKRYSSLAANHHAPRPHPAIRHGQYPALPRRSAAARRGHEGTRLSPRGSRDPRPS